MISSRLTTAFWRLSERLQRPRLLVMNVRSAKMQTGAGLESYVAYSLRALKFQAFEPHV